LQDFLQPPQPPALLSERVAGRLLARELALLVAFNSSAHFLGLGGVESAFAQALAGEGGKCIVGNSAWLADGVGKSQVHV
jgi:hypothetical protein